MEDDLAQAVAYIMMGAFFGSVIMRFALMDKALDYEVRGIQSCRLFYYADKLFGAVMLGVPILIACGMVLYGVLQFAR